jgi:hypothetical protein
MSLKTIFLPTHLLYILSDIYFSAGRWYMRFRLYDGGFSEIVRLRRIERILVELFGGDCVVPAFEDGLECGRGAVKGSGGC